MDQHSIVRMYADTPVLYWPWLWWQLLWVERWIAGLNAGPEDQIYFKLTPRGTIRIAYMSDHLRGVPQPFDCRPKVTFESLTWGYLPAYVWRNQLVVRRAHALVMADADPTPQTTAALLADP